MLLYFTYSLFSLALVNQVIAEPPQKVNIEDALESKAGDHAIENRWNPYKAQVVPTIAYGRPALIGDYPWYASMGNCGGAIASERFVITAAHCLDNPRDNRVWVGGETFANSIIVYYDQVIKHPNYKYMGYLHDIALVRLRTRLAFNEKIQPVRLPAPHENLFPSYSIFTFIGRGTDETGQIAPRLQKSYMNIYPASQCLRHFTPGPITFPGWNSGQPVSYETLDYVSFCIKRSDHSYGICSGDSGSPLVQRNVLYGLGSYNYMPYHNRHTCRQDVSYVTNVKNYVTWINSQISWH